MRTLRVIEATKQEIIGQIEGQVADAAAKADPSNPKGRKTAKEREAFDLVASHLQEVVDLLKDWKIVEDSDDDPEEPPAPATNGSVTHLTRT